MGYFITFEGIEGCGKTTQIRLLAERLKTDGFRVMLTREPGGCPISDKIRTILLDAENQAMYPLTELLLYAAARAQHVSEVIQPALDAGIIVLCDRFTDATLAYQSGGRGIEGKTVHAINALACGTLRPDMTVLIDCDSRVGLERAKRRIESVSGPREERFELEALSFHQRVRDSYLELASSEPGRFLIIDGNGTIDHTAGIVAEKVIPRVKGSSRAVC